MRNVFRRVSDWWHRDRLAAELDDELRFHRQMLERDWLADGSGPLEARGAAARRMGNPTSIKERARDVWNPAWLDNYARDGRVAIRVLKRRAAFSATVIATLALGIGANTLIFTVVDRALLRPLPYANADRLVAVFHRDTKLGHNDKATGAEVAAWSARAGAFSSVAFSWDAQYTLTSVSPRVVLRAFQFSTNFFATLGVHAAVGRTFTPGDEVAGADHVVVLSDHLWKTAFASSPAIVGQVIRLDDAPYVVIGVMPPSFAHPDATTDMWTPLAMPPGLANNNSLRAFSVIARLQPGVSITAASRMASQDVALQTLRDVYLGPARPVIWVLQGAVLLLVLIAAANAVNLFLAHASTVGREVALRRALGASNGRIVSGFMAQGLVLASAGCIIGIGIANVAVALIPAALQQLSGAMPPHIAEGVSGLAIALAVTISLALAFVVGALMALTSRSLPGDALRSDTRHGTATRGVTELRGAMIVAQIAVSLLLLASSGLLIKSYLALEKRSLGFATDDRLTFLLQPDANKYTGQPRMSLYIDEVLNRIRAVPEVKSAAATSAVPMTGTDARRRLVLPGVRDSAGASVIHYRVVSSEYFATMEIPLRTGRPFTSDDRAGGIEVALVNEALARTRWPGESPVGKTVTIAGGPTPSIVQIIGVVGDVRHEGLAADVQPEIYRPVDQAYWPFFGIVVKTATDASRMTKDVERAVWAVDATQPIDRVRTLESVAAESVALRRTSMLVISAFAIAAALLAGVGIYGVISYVVSLRTREIGIRVALGARPAEVIREIVRSGVRLAVAGAIVGLAATYELTRFLSTLLFGVAPRDPSSIAAAFVAILAVSAVASFIPARRAARIDPAITLRTE